MEIVPQSPYSGNDKRVIRHNRNPLPSQRARFEEESALNNSLIQTLQMERDMRMRRLKDIQEEVKLKGAQVTHAELRLETAMQIFQSLSQTELTLSRPLDIANKVQKASSESPTSSHVLAAVASLNVKNELLSDLKRHIDSSRISVRLAQEAIDECLQEQQEVWSREAQCLALIDSLSINIQEILKINNMRSHRAIWRVNDHIWQHIFLEVVSSKTDSLSHSHTSPILLSSICYSWRIRAHDYPLLWKTIHIGVGRFSRQGMERVTHYYKLSGGYIQDVILELQSNTLQTTISLLAESLSLVNHVRLLVFTGDPAGKTSVDSDEPVVNSILPVITFERLEYAYSKNALSPPAHGFSRALSKQFNELTMKNSILQYWVRPARQDWTLQLQKFTLVLHGPTPRIRWHLFHQWLTDIRSTLESLVLDMGLPETPSMSADAQTISFGRLRFIAISLQLLLFLHRSCFHTPLLSSLEILGSLEVDLEEWSRYAGDIQGGANITRVTICATQSTNFAFYAACLRSLPRLKTLTLDGEAVDAMLALLTTPEASKAPVSEEAFQPILKSLEDLSISGYRGDGEAILTFVQCYLFRAEAQRTTSGRVLGLQLLGCSNISREVMEELKTIGSIV